VVDGKIFSQFGPIRPHQPATNQFKKKVPKALQKRKIFKKFITNLNLKIFPKSQQPTPRHPKTDTSIFPSEIS
jgi:hypothetical protein